MDPNLSTNRKFKMFFMNSLSILVILALAYPLTASASVPNAVTADPHILAAIIGNWIHAFDFSAGGTLHIQIYESQGGLIQWDDYRTADGSGHVFVGSWEHHVNLAPGSYITISDGVDTKSLELEAVTLDVFDVDADYLAGTAPPAVGGRPVWVGTGNESYGCAMDVTADALTGAWEADFASDVVPCDVTEDMWAAAQVFDADGDVTEANPIPEPYFVVFPEWESFDGINWPDNATVDITVVGKDVCTTSAESWMYFFNGGFPDGCDLVIGDIVTFTDGVTTRTHTVQNLDVTDVDIVADTVSGTADAGAIIDVWPNETGEALEVTAGPGGDWSVDFSAVYDIVAGTYGRSAIWDAQGNATQVEWGIPSPYMVVFPEWEWFDGKNWPDGSVTISVTGKPECATQGVSDAYFFNGSFPEGCDLEIGDTVIFTDGVTTRTHIVQNLAVTGVDIVNDTVSGTADAGATVQVWPHQTGEVLELTADPAGTWQADFNAIYDLVEGSDGRSVIGDAQGNGTAVDWMYPDPHFTVFPKVEWLDGLDWPDGATVTITVADKPECELEKESLDYFFNGNFPDGCDLEIGDTVTFTDGITVRTHIVQNLDITSVDIATDTVSGTADTGAVVHVWVWGVGDAVELTVTGGAWEVDFGALGINLQEGMGIRSEIRDEQGNATSVDYWIPNPRMVVFPEWEFFDGLDWPDGATVSISVADKPVCATEKVSADFFFNGNFPDGCDLEIGDQVTFTDGETVRTHTVQNLSVTDVDKAADTVEGTADEDALIYVWPHGGPEVQVTAGASGTWLADFSGVFDLVSLTAGRSEIRDEAGNATAVDWLARFEVYLPVLTKRFQAYCLMYPD